MRENSFSGGARRARSAACLLLALAAGTARAQPGALDPVLRRLKGKTKADLEGAAVVPKAVDMSRAEPTVRVHLRLRPGADRAALAARFPRARLGGLNGRFATAEVPLSDLAALESDLDVERAEAARLGRKVLDVVRSSTVVSGLYLGVLDANSTDFGTNLGQGVVYGTVDTGIDWKHLDFVNLGSPNTTRILSIWDQTDSGVSPGPPTGFAYGTEWTQAQINAELGPSPPGVVREKDTDGHGTHTSGIGAGNGNATNGATPAGTYVGLAPKADIIMVKSSFLTTSVIDGINYIASRAAAQGKRAVINLSLGSDFGPHDGTDSFAAQLDAIAASTPVAIAAGNSQTVNVHAVASVGVGGSVTVTVATQAALGSFDLDFWVPSGDAYTCTVTTSATGTGSVSAAAGNDIIGSIGPVTIQVNNATSGGHPNGDHEILVTVSQSPSITPPNFRLTFLRTSSGGTGRLDGYSVEAAVGGPQFIDHVNLTGTVSDWATGSRSISAGSYCSKRLWTAIDNNVYFDIACTPQGGGAGNNTLLGDISVFSGRGPTRPTGVDSGRIKPELAAPGHEVASSMSADTTPPPSTPIIMPDGRHVLDLGTSMAAPAAAGLAALMLQRRPDFTPAQVAAEFDSQARADALVNSYGAPPNDVFGHGKLKACLFATQPTGFTVQTLGVSSISWTWGASEKAVAYSIAYATNPASLIATVNAPSFSFTGLLANTTYQLQVTATNSCGGSLPAVSPATMTYSAPLASAASSVFFTSAAATYTPLPPSPSSASCFGYLLQASTAADFTGTIFSSSTPNSALGTLTVAGLTSSTQYFLRIGTLNGRNAPDFISPAPNPVTTGTIFPPGALPFSNVVSTALQANWTTGGNVAGTMYVAQLSTAANFTGTLLSSSTLNLSAMFSSLSIDTTYYARVQAVGGPFTVLGSTITLAAPPSSPGFNPVFETSMTVVWAANGNPAQTTYVAQISSASDFSYGVLSSSTFNTFAAFLGLARNTTYYLHLSAVNFGGTPTTVASATSTLSAQPGQPASPFVQVTSSITVQWIALPLSPQSAGCEGYRVDAALDPAFTAGLVSNETHSPSANQLGVSGLLFNTTYYLRVGALNWEDMPNYIFLGSTMTAFGTLSSARASDTQTVRFALPSPFPSLVDFTLEIPPGAFPGGTLVTMAANVGFLFQNPTTNEVLRITSLGPNAGVDLSAGGLQPAKPLLLYVHYAPSAIGPGQDARAIVVARFVPEEQLWSLVPTDLDSGRQEVVGHITHFSLFAPFFVTAASVLDTVNVFPVPWMPGSGDPLYDAAAVTFSNLPLDGKIKIYTMRGELVWQSPDAISGVQFWSGVNSSGHAVGSGTYVVVITGSGAHKVRRVTVIR